MDKKLDVVSKDNKNKENVPQDKKINTTSQNVSPYPEWNEDIHRIVVGYH
jgi:hypothetical protein